MVFSPGAGQKRNMLAGGWTQDRFLKMMYQIPEMELYLETKGYKDFSKYEWGPTPQSDSPRYVHLPCTM